VFVKYGFREGLKAGFQDAAYWAGLTIRIIGKLFSGKVSWRSMSGPVGIASVTSQAARAGVSRFIMLIVIISVNLGILNLIPIPVLDGSHILITLIESAMRRPLNKKVKASIFTFFYFLLISFMILITFNDLLRLREPIGDWFLNILKSLGIK
jgi:regulator of sigma E protease